MGYALLNFAHILGAVLIGGGLIAVWVSDLRSRQVHELSQFAEAVRYIAVFYDGVVVPGALLLLVSGAWLMGGYLGGWGSLRMPWLAGMVTLFAFEFVEGNTITRLYFMRLRRMTREALRIGRFTPELERERAKTVPSFTHFLDLPILFVIIALGALKPETWDLFLIGSLVAVAVAAALTVYIRRLYPWPGPKAG